MHELVIIETTNWVFGVLSRGQSGRGVKLTTCDHLAFRCRMCGVLPLLPYDTRLHGLHRDSLSVFNLLAPELFF